MSFYTGTASNFLDLANQVKAYLTGNGSAYGRTYSGVGTGEMSDFRGGTSSVAETFTITATSATSWTVVGSVSGSIGPATTGALFNHAKIHFLISAGGTPFQAGDVWHISTANKWASSRTAEGAVLTATQGNGGQFGVQNLADGKSTADDDRIWRVLTPVTLPQDIEISFRGGAKTLTHYELAYFTNQFYSYAPSAWTFDYWNGSAWVTLDTQSGVTTWSPTEVKRFAIGTPASSALYRLHITATPYPADRLILGAIRAYTASNFGRDEIFGEFIFKALGNDGVSAFYSGIHLFERQDADYFNWEVASFDGFNTNGRFYEQAGIERRVYLPLKNGTMPYWLIYNGRRAVLVVSVGTGYEIAILGAGLDPYFSPAQWPMPILFGASLAFGEAARLPFWDSTEWRYSNGSNHHRSPVHSDHGYLYVYVKNHEWYQLRARHVDGSWFGCESTVEDIATATPASDQAIVWPFRCGMTNLDQNPDGGKTLWPIMICLPAPDIIGELSGVAYVSGQGLTAESLIRRGMVDWLVLPNITRTDRDDWFAVALD